MTYALLRSLDDPELFELDEEPEEASDEPFFDEVLDELSLESEELLASEDVLASEESDDEPESDEPESDEPPPLEPDDA